MFGLSYTFAAVCDCGDPSAWRNNKHLGCAHHPPLPEGESPPRQQGNAPPALCQALYDTIVVVIEFIIRVLQHSPLPNDFGKLPATRAEMWMGTGPSGEPKDRRARGPWAVTGWADDKHVLREVTRQFRDALGVTWEVADKAAKEMDEVVSIRRRWGADGRDGRCSSCRLWTRSHSTLRQCCNRLMSA